jgi:succinate dehydrogenase / fumarate reductase cytochrome b subunit
MASETETPVRRDRPTSPHIQIYRWQWTMALSILHRATGVALTVGTLLLTWWIVAAAAGPGQFAAAQSFIGSIVGQILLFGWTVALFYHLCNGIRHLLWDAGKGFELGTAHASAIVVLIATAALTVAAWLIGYAV